MKNFIKNYFPRIYRWLYIVIKRRRPKKILSNHYHFPVEYIRGIETKFLLDRRYLEHNLILRMGLSNDAVNMPLPLFPYRGGLELWQLPIQLAPFMIEIMKHNISSYLEIGINKGGMFIFMNEMLEKNCPNFTYSLGLDTLDVPMIRNYCFANTKAHFKKIDSQSYDLIKFLERKNIVHFDLIFIDGDHSYEGATNDFHFALQFNARLIAFHDIAEPSCPGVVKLWKEVKKGYRDEFTFKEFDQPVENLVSSMGIGLMIRK